MIFLYTTDRAESQGQCDQIARLFFNIGPFITIGFHPKALKFTKDGINFCQILVKLVEIAQRLSEYCQIDKFSPNLVSLKPTNVVKVWWANMNYALRVPYYKTLFFPNRRRVKCSTNICCFGVAAIAPWFRLRLPIGGPGFKTHLCFFQFVLLKL